MGKQYLCIANRGTCPRILLEILGATTKRARFADPSQGGWFGTGTIFAPIAALRLGIEIFFSSSDSRGPYLITYDTVTEVEDGFKIERVVWRLVDGTIVSTPYDLGTAMNWDRPIEADTMKAFRVLREYLRNAKDADPEAPKPWIVDTVTPAPQGWTYVFVDLHDDFVHMLQHSKRYFKYLDATLSVFMHEGLGAIYAKSEAGKTRLFSLGTLAACSEYTNLTTVFDYDLHDKNNLNEERTFVSMAQVHHDVARLLGHLRDLETAKTVLSAALDGSGMFERQALGDFGISVKDNPEKYDLGVWLLAWHALLGPNAVIATSAYADEYARYKGNSLVDVSDARLRAFLKLCGATASGDLVTNTSDYVIAEPTEAQKRNLDFAKEVLRKEGLLAPGSETSVVAAKSHKKDPDCGFCLYKREPILIYILDKTCNDYDTCLAVLYHEHRHGRTKVPDDSRVFQHAADADVVASLNKRHGRPDAPRNEPPEITDGDIDALFGDVKVDLVMSPTEAALELIGKAIEKAELKPPDEK